MHLALPILAPAAGGTARSTGGAAVGAASSLPSWIRRHADAQRRCPLLVAPAVWRWPEDDIQARPLLAATMLCAASRRQPSGRSCLSSCGTNDWPASSWYRRSATTSSAGCGRDRIGPQVEPFDVTGSWGVPGAAAAVTFLTTSPTTSRIQLRSLSSWQAVLSRLIWATATSVTCGWLRWR